MPMKSVRPTDEERKPRIVVEEDRGKALNHRMVWEGLREFCNAVGGYLHEVYDLNNAASFCIEGDARLLGVLVRLACDAYRVHATDSAMATFDLEAREEATQFKIDTAARRLFKGAGYITALRRHADDWVDSVLTDFDDGAFD